MAEGLPHALTLTGREKCVVTGVTEVGSFNEQMVVLATDEGPLTILGDGLKIGRLSLADGQLNVEGHICALSYEERRGKGGFFARALR